MHVKTSQGMFFIEIYLGSQGVLRRAGQKEAGERQTISDSCWRDGGRLAATSGGTHKGEATQRNQGRGYKDQLVWCLGYKTFFFVSDEQVVEEWAEKTFRDKVSSLYGRFVREKEKKCFITLIIGVRPKLELLFVVIDEDAK